MSDEALPEISVDAYEKLDYWRAKIDQATKQKKRDLFELAASDLFAEAEYERDLRACQSITDAVYALGSYHAGLSDDDIQFIMIGAKAEAERPINGHVTASSDEPPPAMSPEHEPKQGRTNGRDSDEAQREEVPKVFWHGAVDYRASRPQLVQNVIPEVGHGLIAGQWGTFKTFGTFDLAHSCMSGEPWLGYEIMRRGGVLFIALEGLDEVAIRRPPLVGKNAADEICKIAEAIAKELEERFGVPLVLIIIDTVIAGGGYSKDGQENDSAAGQAVMNTLKQVARRTRCFVFGVDHFGKAVETGTRGTSAKEASADVVIAMLGDKAVSGEVTNTRLALRKRRGGANGEEHFFRARKVDMGVDSFGKPMSTLVLDWSEAQTAQPAAKERWSKSLRFLRQVLMTILADAGRNCRPYADGPTVRACELEAVRREFCRQYPADGDEKQKAHTRLQAFYRAIKAAQDGLIAIREIDGAQLVWLTKPETGVYS